MMSPNYVAENLIFVYRRRLSSTLIAKNGNVNETERKKINKDFFQ